MDTPGRGSSCPRAPPPGDCDFDDNRDILALFGLPGHDPARFSQGQSQIEEVWAVDVDGLIVVLIGTYYADTPQNVVDELRAIVESATFESDIRSRPVYIDSDRI